MDLNLLTGKLFSHLWGYSKSTPSRLGFRGGFFSTIRKLPKIFMGKKDSRSILRNLNASNAKCRPKNVIDKNFN